MEPVKKAVADDPDETRHSGAHLGFILTGIRHITLLPTGKLDSSCRTNTAFRQLYQNHGALDPVSSEAATFFLRIGAAFGESHVGVTRTRTRMDGRTSGSLTKPKRSKDTFCSETNSTS